MESMRIMKKIVYALCLLISFFTVETPVLAEEISEDSLKERDVVCQYSVSYSESVSNESYDVQWTYFVGKNSTPTTVSQTVSLINSLRLTGDFHDSIKQ